MKKTRLYDLLLISLFSALIAVCSFISIPTPIPFTLQTFALFTALMTLGGKGGFADEVRNEQSVDNAVNRGENHHYDGRKNEF
jgi:hypothetical protein